MSSAAVVMGETTAQVDEPLLRFPVQTAGFDPGRTRKRTRHSSCAESPCFEKLSLESHGLPAVPVDSEEQELLRELAAITGGGTTTDALQKALNRLRGSTPSTSQPPAQVQTPPTPHAADAEPVDCTDFDLELADEQFLSDLAHIPCCAESIARSFAAGPPEPQQRGTAAEPDPEPESQVVGLDYARVMDSHGFGLVLMDLSGRFVHWNQTMEKVLGYSTQEMRQLSMMHVTPVEDLPAMMQLMPRLLGGPGEQPPTIASPLHLMKRCVSRSGQDLKFHVRMSVMSAADAPIVTRGHGMSDRLISCLVDCHGPHTWELPIPSGVAMPPGLCAFGRRTTHDDSPVLRAQAAAACAPGSDVLSVASKKSKARVPLPRQAVAELRDLLKEARYPEPAARESISQRYGLDRKRVDRWLENTRARQVAQAKAAQSQADRGHRSPRN
jgi:PAS domain S-box-containing protein